VLCFCQNADSEIVQPCQRKVSISTPSGYVLEFFGRPGLQPLPRPAARQPCADSGSGTRRQNSRRLRVSGGSTRYSLAHRTRSRVGSQPSGSCRSAINSSGDPVEGADRGSDVLDRRTSPLDDALIAVAWLSCPRGIEFGCERVFVSEPTETTEPHGCSAASANARIGAGCRAAGRGRASGPSRRLQHVPRRR